MESKWLLTATGAREAAASSSGSWALSAMEAMASNEAISRSVEAEEWRSGKVKVER